MVSRKAAGLIIFILALGLTAYAAGGMTEKEREGSGGIRGPAYDTSSARSPGVVNVNTASADELRRLPGISNELADNIVSYRDSNGPFGSIQDLRNVNGMTKAEFRKIKQYVVLQGDTTLMAPDSKTTMPAPGTSIQY